MAREWRASGAAVAALCLAACLPAHAHASELDWMAGRWCGQRDGVFNEEVWMAPSGGLLLGMHRDMRAGKPVGFEFMRIARENGKWAYHAQPGGAKAVTFTADAVDGDTVVFANPQHDFPKRVRYRRVDAQTLQASIDDGTDTGARMQWTWTRECAMPEAE